MDPIKPKKDEPSVKVDSNIPNFNETEFAQQKAERAHAFIAKHGLPPLPKEEKRKGIS